MHLCIVGFRGAVSQSHHLRRRIETLHLLDYIEFEKKKLAGRTPHWPVTESPDARPQSPDSKAQSTETRSQNPKLEPASPKKTPNAGLGPKPAPTFEILQIPNWNRQVLKERGDQAGRTWRCGALWGMPALRRTLSSR